jgi:diacylglycerol kinase family enzyme
MPRAIVLLNPRSRSGARMPIARVLAAFRAAGWTAEVWAGDDAEWSTAAALRARDLGVDAIFGAGGDGLLARILPAVLHTPTALGVIPLGTGNVWARELGLPLQPERAITRQLAGPPRPVDVGTANGRPFLVIASAGLDARIVELVEGDAGA